jgi:hypothetical protein
MKLDPKIYQHPPLFRRSEEYKTPLIPRGLSAASRGKITLTWSRLLLKPNNQVTVGSGLMV